MINIYQLSYCQVKSNFFYLHEFLEPKQWFDRGHDIQEFVLNDDGFEIPRYKAGTFVWAPPPAAADVAIQELRKARHKRQQSLHVHHWQR